MNLINILKKVFNSLKKLNSLFKRKKSIFLIESKEDKKFLIDAIENETLLGVDTEFNWKNTYKPKLSLLQISTKNEIFLIDCCSNFKLSFLKKILESKKKLIIFHSARSDTTVLSTNLNIKIKNAFDIQIAEKIINGGDIKKYGDIVKNYFSKSLSQSETNSNWLKRPFSQKQLEYASEDVEFLIDIYKKQLKILGSRNLLKKAIYESNKEAAFGNRELFISRLKKLKNSSKMEKKIFLWREQIAETNNIPPSYIFKDRNLKKIAKEIKKENIDLELFSSFFQDSEFLNLFLTDMNI